MKVMIGGRKVRSKRLSYAATVRPGGNKWIFNWSYHVDPLDPINKLLVHNIVLQLIKDLFRILYSGKNQYKLFSMI